MSTEKAKLKRRARRYLSIWKENIGLDNDLGLTDINSDAEDLCCGLLNIVLGAQLQNMNLLQMNFPAIDLADRDRRICVQVTSTAGAGKIAHTLERFFAHHLDQDYDRLIVMILGNKKQYRSEFPGKDGFRFQPERDIWDIRKLLTEISALSMPQLYRVDAYLREQFQDLGELVQPMDLPVLSALDDATFLGRDGELNTIARLFDQNEKIVILSGLGGMGKSELAVRFAQTRWGGESYFVHFTKSWRQTVLENIAPRIRGLNRDTTDTERIYRDAMAELRNRDTEELLILDNVDQEEASLTQLKRQLSELRMRIIITTRTDTERAVPVEQLRQPELYRLFELHESDASPEDQRALIEAVDGHTLTVDLMARALRPGRKAATAEKLLRDLSDQSIRKVQTAYHGAPAQARIIEHLKVVFRVSNLDLDEQELLRYAALLPENGMPEALFLAPIPKDMDDAMDSLADNGWLQWKDPMLRIHPVIRKVCLDVLAPGDENCGEYLDGLIALHSDSDFRLDRCRQMAELLSNASCYLEDARGRWSLKAGERWRNVGAYMQAQKYSIRAMERIRANPVPDDAALAQAYNNVGCTCYNLGDHRKGLEYQLKALAIREKILPPDSSLLAQSYNNVGTAYNSLVERKKALKYQRKAIAIEEKIQPEKNLNLASYCNNIAQTYTAQGDHQKALTFQERAIAIQESVLPPDHPDLAGSYDNAGCIYDGMQAFEKALQYHHKALAIWEKALPSDHHDLAICCSNVACSSLAAGNLREAAHYMRRAADIVSRSSLPKDHPDRARCANAADILEKEYRTQQMMLEKMKEWTGPPFGFPGK